MAALSHVIDGNSGEYNVPLVRERLLHLDIVVLEWAKRTQGLIVAPDNPLGLEGVQDLQNKSARIVLRQNQAGSHVLLLELLAQAGVDFDDLKFSSRRARSEMELGLAVLEERADAGLAIAAVAHQLRLGFVPLHEERCDIVIRRREFFESPFECLMAFTRDPAFTQRARELGGYDVSAVGRVAYNSP